ncbi:hypothetical protein LP417_22800 [Polaromonas sp. P1-6]|nr:hypothetical protein LP417_22800 [Polaromonas sp. P1-6]
MAADTEPALAKDAALTLLQRSIQFGHPRLAVIRLSMAAFLGAEITADQYQYCQAAAERSRDPELLTLLSKVQPVNANASPGSF